MRSYNADVHTLGSIEVPKMRIVPANSKPLFSSIRVRDDSHARDPHPVWAWVHKEHMHYISTNPENPINIAKQFVDPNVQIQDLINFILKPIETKISVCFDPIF